MRARDCIHVCKITLNLVVNPQLLLAGPQQFILIRGKNRFSVLDGTDPVKKILSPKQTIATIPGSTQKGRATGPVVQNGNYVARIH